jgi:hypothetical protein
MNKLLVFVISFILSPVAFAGVIYPFTPELDNSVHVEIGGNGDNCQLSAMTITSMINLTGGSNPSPLPVTATDCYAVTAPDNDFNSSYIPNTGELNDGMFNGESKSFTDKGEKTEYYVDPNLFLDDLNNDQWVDQDTPGWISLASVGVSGGKDNDPLNFNVDYSTVGIYDLDLLLDITFGINDDDTGFWSLGFDADAADIIGDIEALLGRPTRFDHLSFVLKGASKEDWYMYDFSFWDLMAGGLDVDLNAPHYIEGVWDPSKFFGGKDVSHIEIVAHDPPQVGPDIKIPEPQSLVILGLGLILLALRHKINF